MVHKRRKIVEVSKTTEVTTNNLTNHLNERLTEVETNDWPVDSPNEADKPFSGDKQSNASVKKHSNENNVNSQQFKYSPTGFEVKGRKKSLKEEVDILLNHNRSSKTFRDSLFVEDFLDFCFDSIPFSFTTSSWELKGPLKTYVVQNYYQITSHITREINKIPLLQICSTLHCISGALTSLEQCIVFHDILLMIDDYTKFHFIFHSLFKNKGDDHSLIYTTILSLMAYQQKVDLEYHKSRKALIQHIASLRHNFEIPKVTKKLEDILVEMTSPINVFTHKTIDENVYQHVFSIRMLTHYLDWDYTFNVYVNDVLYPRVDDSDAYLLFLGIVNFNFYRLFGEIESTEMIFDLIKSKMVGVSSASVLSYLLIKQIDPKQANAWLSLNTNQLISEGWSIEYLSVYLLF